jgi:hypothetical protein
MPNLSYERNNKDVWQPIRVSAGEIDAFINKHPEISVVDEMRRNLGELCLLRNPKYRFDKNYQPAFEVFFGEHGGGGNWFYFPWLNTLVRYLPEDLHLELRTGRNKYLITGEEQARFYNATVAFLGMRIEFIFCLFSAFKKISVGSKSGNCI